MDQRTRNKPVAPVHWIVAFAFLLFSVSDLLIAESGTLPMLVHGEFPFVLTYSVDGESRVVEDSVVCRYAGKSPSGSGSKWTQSLKSGSRLIVLKVLDDGGLIYFPQGGCKGYMGDWQRLGSFDPSKGKPAVQYKSGSVTRSSALDPQVAEEEHGLRIISWEFTPPITQPVR